MARQKIIEIRKLRKLTQAALGKQAGLTAAEISRIECGYRDMNKAEATSIAKALGVSLVSIYDRPETLVPPAPVGMAAAARLAAASNPDSLTAAAPAAPAKASPSESNLDDPVNFRELPDASVLERGALDPTAFRSRLAEALARATKILHTPRVPAGTWRAWREFERKLQDHLRGPAPTT